ncbi:hypothetical protein AB0L05_25495 [Nonomuraea pusilla]|uniref:hypothetical protein n=1 Tax=Nonomuraea pusilla TaxID=46177 RepID=UPI00332F736E
MTRHYRRITRNRISETDVAFVRPLPSARPAHPLTSGRAARLRDTAAPRRR